MPNIHFILKDGSVKTVEAATGSSVMQAAIKYNVKGIYAECGGALMCATCHVFVEEGFLDRLPPRNAKEIEMLGETAQAQEANSRLCCQITVTDELDGIVLRLPAKQVK